MQPYFLPYAGYFRLFASADLFVIYDCVQFPRRGWADRNRGLNPLRIGKWLTVTLMTGPPKLLIRDLRFRPDATELMAQRLRRFQFPHGTSGSLGQILETLP